MFLDYINCSFIFSPNGESKSLNTTRIGFHKTKIASRFHFRLYKSNCFLSLVLVRGWRDNNSERNCHDLLEFICLLLIFVGSVDCTLKFSHPAWYWENLLKICVFIFAFIMPILIITVCYGLMILRLKSVRMLSGSKEKDRNLRRITRMVLVVVAVFIVCWTPIHIYVIIKALIHIPETTFQTISWHFCIALGYTNSCLNPILYAFLDENFKRCFREFCIPTTSTIEQQNSTRIRQHTRERASSAHTMDRTNQQV